jgi:hypothetical protein
VSGCNILFRRFFVPWHRLPPGAKGPRILKGDIELHPDAAGQPAAAAWRLPLDRQQASARQVARMVDAARADWPTYLEVDEVVSVEAIDAFDAHWTRPRIAELLRASDRSDFTNDYVVLCGELGAVLGEVMRRALPSLEWLYSDPYWESSLWFAPTGGRIHPFHWAIKKMSSYGADNGLRPKLLVGLESIQCEAAES